MNRRACHARQYGDQTQCGPCGLAWDTNDPEPPQCGRYDARLRVCKESAAQAAEKGATGRDSRPVTLPMQLAADMAKVYDNSGGGLRGMQAAYRVFLDRTGE
jgi:hypothetical protein